MNLYQLELYTNLMSLCESGETFYFQDFKLDASTYRIFNYRLASYTDFQKPGGLECRGHMFEMDSAGNAIRLAAMPMEKFFNLNENPSTMNLDLSTVVSIETKADGSLMSTYIHNPGDGNEVLRLKSKGSLFSEQALDAMAFLAQPSQRALRDQLRLFTESGATVNLEWVSPQNRIVLGYMEPKLIVLNVRSVHTGMYFDANTLDLWKSPPVNLKGLSPAEFVAQIPLMTEDIEGFVVRLASGQRVKVKTDKYCSLHHAKDSINNPRRLFEAIIDEGIDDLRSMFSTDALAIKTIDEMQEKVDRIYNHMVVVVESFYNENKHLDRKDYAIKGRNPANLDQLYFGLAMNLYIGKPVNYKEFIKGKYKELGFKDEKVEVSE